MGRAIFGQARSPCTEVKIGRSSIDGRLDALSVFRPRSRDRRDTVSFIALCHRRDPRDSRGRYGWSDSRPHSLMATVPGLRWDCWPEIVDQLLLRSIIDHDDDEALRAWRDASKCFDLDAPDHERRGLYGLLAHRIGRLAPDESALPILQREARSIAARTLGHLAHMDEPIALLESAGIHPVVLKGAALLLSVYESTAWRRIADLDLLVPPDRLADAVEVLVAAGWTTDQRDHLGNHAIGMTGGAIDVDLHRAVSPELVTPDVASGGTALFTFRTAPRTLPSGRPITILTPTDALVHTVVHGLQWNGPICLRWVPDAALLVEQVDHDRLCHLARTFSIAPLIHDALRFLDRLGRPIDPTLLARLDSIRTTRLDDLRLRAFHERPVTPGAPPPLGFTRARFLQRTKGDGLPRAISRIPRFLEEQFDASGPLSLLRRMAGAGLIRTGQWVGGGSSSRPQAHSIQAQSNDPE